MLQRIAQEVGESLRSLIRRPRTQIPALDALRAAAILLVLATHARRYYTGPSSGLSESPLVVGGWIGVPLFFVLSGYLIGKQLWSELGRTGRVDIARFILRRGLRIWPAYFVALFGFGALGMIMLHRAPSLLHEALFLSNYDGMFGSSAEHVIPADWSLATEEQFYIVTPLAIALLSRRFDATARAYRRLLVGALLAEPVVRAATIQLFTSAAQPPEQTFVISFLYHPFHTNADGLLVGLVLANVWVAGQGIRESLTRHRWLIAAACIVGAIALRKSSSLVLTYSALALVFGGLANVALGPAEGPVMRFLAWRGWYPLSRLSYSMYLVHEGLLALFARPLQDALAGLAPALQYMAMFGVTVVASGALAIVLFVGVEQPFLKVRDRWGYLRRSAPQAIPQTAS